MKTPSIARLLALIGLSSAGVLALVLLPVQEWTGRFLDWVQGIGAWGPVVVIAAIVLACVLFIPGSLMTLGAGFLFGIPLGTVTVSIGSTLGASAAFFLGRTLTRDLVERRITTHPRFHAIDRAVGSQGFKVVLLVRLSPLFPFNFLNYALGVTKVTFRDYVLASWIGMLPGTVMYVYLGSAAHGLSDALQGKVRSGPEQKALFVIGLVATIVVTGYVTRIARQALATTEEPCPTQPPQTSP
jgi:uncharacterized membrane protein YdjX (TVP38/TMEM64 family)